MTVTLSVLDPSPVFQGRTSTDALNETRSLAQAADRLGYRAYWVQEHHNAASFAGTAPEVQMADLAARTERIILGSGGIMLPNYSPLKVAEWANTLNALHPGRIEIGIGRATGGDPRASAALLGPGADNFPQMLRLFMDWLLDASGTKALPDNHRAKGIGAYPSTGLSGVWMLCSSPQSAAFAGAMGLKLAFADFLNPGGATEALKAYRNGFHPSEFAAEPWCAIGLTALAAETEAEARRLSATVAAWSLSRGAGQYKPYLDAAAAQAYLDAASLEAPKRGIVGGAPDVAERLQMAADEAGADELFILTIAESLEARIASYEGLMQAWPD